jgi:hypothetical protein
MFRGLSTASLPLIKLFDNPYLFTVPAYQRPYSWTTREAGQLLEDLTIAAGLDEAETAWPDYFLGTVLLLDPENDAATPPSPFVGRRVFDVVDGQQRLVTLSILASILRDFIDRDGRGMPESGLAAARLHAMVAVAPDERDLSGRRSRLQLRDDEQAYFESQVLARSPRPVVASAVTHPGAAAVQLVHDHLAGEIEALNALERQQLAQYLMDDCHVVVIVTRDIDRAHRLFTVLNQRGKPLERKDILKAEVLKAIPAVTAPKAIERWEAAQNRLGLEFEDFMAHLRLIHGLQKLPIISGVRALVREFGSERFLAEQLEPLTEAFHRVRTFADGPDAAAHPELTAALVALNRLGKADWVPACILAMAEFPTAPDRATQLIVEIERFVSLLRLLCQGSGKRQRRFNAVLGAMRDGGDGLLSHPAWQVSTDEQRIIAHHLKDFHRRSPQTSKFLLMRLEDDIAGVPLRIDPMALTVEHVLPLRPAATSVWRQDFVDAEERADCQGSLGNLALVTLRQNEKARNRDFHEKLAIYRDPEADMPPMQINADILASSEWRMAVILAREQRLLTRIGRFWRIDLGVSPGRQRQSRAG